MTGKRLLVLGAVVAAGLLLLLAACEDEPTQAEAEQQFCDDVGAYLAALGALRDIDKSTTVDEFDQLRENVKTTHANMVASAEELKDVRLDDLEEAEDNLRSAIDDIDDDQSLQEARGSIQDEVDEVAKQMSQVLNDVDCGSGQGGQEQSDE